MARAIWSGSISFGLVSVPVKLFTAVSPKAVRFHMVHDADGGRIREKRVCSVDGKEVPFEHIVKGYELSTGKYVKIDPQELEKLDPKTTHSIDIEDFVGLTEIDPIYFDSTYYLVPDRSAGKPYALLLEAMEKTSKIGIGRMVLRTKQYLCALRPRGNALVLSTLLYADELVDQHGLGVPKLAKPSSRELEMAEQLIGSLSTTFEPKKYKDEYRQRVLKLIEKKSDGEELKAPSDSAGPEPVLSLMDALQKSLEPKRAGGRRHPAAAPRRGRTRPHKTVRAAAR